MLGPVHLTKPDATSGSDSSNPPCSQFFCGWGNTPHWWCLNSVCCHWAPAVPLFKKLWGFILCPRLTPKLAGVPCEISPLTPKTSYVISLCSGFGHNRRMSVKWNKPCIGQSSWWGGLETLSHEERLKTLEGSMLEKRHFPGNTIATFQYLKGCPTEYGADTFTDMLDYRAWTNTTQTTAKVSSKFQEEFPDSEMCLTPIRWCGRYTCPTRYSLTPKHHIKPCRISNSGIWFDRASEINQMFNEIFDWYN